MLVLQIIIPKIQPSNYVLISIKSDLFPGKPLLLSPSAMYRNYSYGPGMLNRNPFKTSKSYYDDYVNFHDKYHFGLWNIYVLSKYPLVKDRILCFALGLFYHPGVFIWCSSSQRCLINIYLVLSPHFELQGWNKSSNGIIGKYTQSWTSKDPYYSTKDILFS